MANNCDTTYRVVGEHDSLTKLHDILSKVHKESQWFSLHDVICEITGCSEDDYTYNARGWVLDFYMDDDDLVICQDTAWCEQPDFRHVIEEYFKDTRVYYLAIELGMEIFETNDSEGQCFTLKWLVDYDSSIHEFEYDYELIDWMNMMFETPDRPDGFKDLDDVMSFKNEHNGRLEESGDYEYFLYLYKIYINEED